MKGAEQHRGASCPGRLGSYTNVDATLCLEDDLRENFMAFINDAKVCFLFLLTQLGVATVPQIIVVCPIHLEELFTR